MNSDFIVSAAVGVSWFNWFWMPACCTHPLKLNKKNNSPLDLRESYSSLQPAYFGGGGNLLIKYVIAVVPNPHPISETQVDEPVEAQPVMLIKSCGAEGERGAHSTNQKQLQQIPVTGFCLGASYFWMFALSCISPSVSLLFTLSFLLIHHAYAGRWVLYNPSASQCWQQ